ncbi:MAG: hypothetical protein JJ902_17180 [Roseibium sp.]|nr:hypothetical protein [Roseibium sp.]
MADLSRCIESTSFRIMSCAILKDELNFDLFPDNPYSIALRICLQKAWVFLERRGESDSITHFIFEKRGKKEDAELELEFRRIVSGENNHRIPYSSFRIHFSDKRTNSTGMQIADLTARPIALNTFRSNQNNRAFNIIAKKIFKGKSFSNVERGIYG